MAQHARLLLVTPVSTVECLGTSLSTPLEAAGTHGVTWTEVLLQAGTDVASAPSGGAEDSVALSRAEVTPC